MKTLRFALLIAALAMTVSAATIEPTKDSTQATVLQSQVGKTVELHLKSGEKIGGKVTFVGANVVHLTALTGMDLFEATVTIADVSAVVVRTAK
ncbi:MAG: hypothetical protein ABI672_11325 [Vicinamibacteria bacterium]